jgi:hypothetical protein
MARTPATAEQRGTVVPISSGPPPTLAGRMAEAQGRGVSQDQADNLVPLIYVLQPGSPQAKRDEPQYMEGAEAGMIWLRSSREPLVDGKAGILFQPCYFYKDIVEWRPRALGGGSGAGFVGRHPSLEDVRTPDGQPDCAQVQDPQDPTRMKWVRKSNQNDLVETRYHAGWVLGHGPAPEPYLIPLSGTGHSFSRDWMQRMNTALAQPDGKRLDSWWRVWRLTTMYRKNSKGSWYMLTVMEATDADGYPGGWVQTEADLDRGQQLFTSLSSGQLQAEAPQERGDAVTSEAERHI